MSTHEALFYEPTEGGRVRCTLCSLDCNIAPGRRGACGVRINAGGKLYTLVHDRVVARHIDAVEKKPLFHFLPGSHSYSIGTVGCNFRCLHCQNYDISQQSKGWPASAGLAGGEDPDVLCLSLAEIEKTIPGEEVTPQEIVEAAVRSGCRSIAYTYTEPTIFFELALDTARLAAAEGLKNIFVTNGSTSDAALEMIAPVLDAANVDLKGFDEAEHRRMTAAPLAPVLDGIRTYRRLGIWIEVTTLVIPGYNDSEKELRAIAEFVRDVGDDIPWHVSQFYPTYRLLEREPTPVSTLRRARQIGLDAGLKYVYEGNVPGEGGESTYCHACGARIIRRHGFQILENRVRDGRCAACGVQIPGVWEGAS